MSHGSAVVAGVSIRVCKLGGVSLGIVFLTRVMSPSRMSHGSEVDVDR